MKPAANPVASLPKMTTMTEEEPPSKDRNSSCCPDNLYQRILKTFNWIILVSFVFLIKTSSIIVLIPGVWFGSFCHFPLDFHLPCIVFGHYTQPHVPNCTLSDLGYLCCHSGHFHSGHHWGLNYKRQKVHLLLGKFTTWYIRYIAPNCIITVRIFPDTGMDDWSCRWDAKLHVLPRSAQRFVRPFAGCVTNAVFLRSSQESTHRLDTKSRMYPMKKNR